MQCKPIHESMKEVGSQVRETLPHIVIGKDKKPNDPNNSCVDNPDWTNKLKQWGLIICVTIVVTYAIYRLIF